LILKALGAVAAALLITLAAACGEGSDDEEAAAPPTVVPTQAAVREAAPVLPVTVPDVKGNNVTVKDVSRIIPLNGDIAEVVYALGLGENVVGTDTSATYPEAAKAKQKIGYQRTLSAEGILSLNPTLIIGNENAGPPEVIEQIKAIGVPVVIIRSTTSLDDVGTKIRTVARALGVPVRGEELAKTTASEIKAAKDLAAKATTKPKVMFLYLRGATVQHIMGKGSGADSLIVTAAGADVGADAGIQGSKPITPEALVAAQPDVFLVLTAGLQSVGGVDGLAQIPGIAQTPAGQNKRVIDMDDQYLLGLGPRAGQALMELVKKLHPELS
jgi:iron complex transport system substrate-binding protein